MPTIPVYVPSLTGNEVDYVMDAVRSGWISSLGQYVDRFEQAIKDVTGARHAIAVSNGSVAIHLALHCVDVGPGDEVIVPTFTYIASVNAITLAGARPVFVDVRMEDWLIDPAAVEDAITPRTKAILPVDLYSAVVSPAVFDIAKAHGIAVVEDSAEVFGTTIGGTHVGHAADVATFSFFGNKTVTTGEGGAVISNDDALAARLRKVKGQGQSLDKRYWHDEVGFNYRMTNICAAIGLAQIERVDQILARKQAIAALYRQELADSGMQFQQVPGDVKSSEWLVSALVPPEADRDEVMRQMAENGVDTRPVFYCAHHMPMYATRQTLPVAEEISRRGISLPSFPDLTDDQVLRVCEVLKAALLSARR
ncbi:DegT/DnrJ/EryC1/StrS aminotransferase family protein [Sphingomonas humi]|uniref:GDP-perosamine synthase RfbE/PerA n=1 Tax=Sphingomonas humi TaxID=335630 RepID=A0ABP7S323_9SPHN